MVSWLYSIGPFFSIEMEDLGFSGKFEYSGAQDLHLL